MIAVSMNGAGMPISNSRRPSNTLSAMTENALSAMPVVNGSLTTSATAACPGMSKLTSTVINSSRIRCTMMTLLEAFSDSSKSNTAANAPGYTASSASVRFQPAPRVSHHPASAICTVRQISNTPRLGNIVVAVSLSHASNISPVAMPSVTWM